MHECVRNCVTRHDCTNPDIELELRNDKATAIALAGSNKNDAPRHLHPTLFEKLHNTLSKGKKVLRVQIEAQRIDLSVR